jgi:hypothetical protein
MVELRLRFVHSTTPVAKDWAFAGTNTPDFGGSVCGCVFAGILGQALKLTSWGSLLPNQGITNAVFRTNIGEW